MSFDPAFLDLMPVTVYRSTATGTDLHGVRSYSPPQPYRARVTGITAEMRQRADSQTAAPQAVLWIASTGTGLSCDDRWTVPAGIMSSTAPPILRADCVMDDDGPHHWRLVAGW